LIYGQENLERVDSIKYLGVILDSKLTWAQHISQLCDKLSQIVGILYRLKDFLPSETLRLIYFSLFQSRLQYALCIWGVAADIHTKKLLGLQKKALKNIYNLPIRFSSEKLFSEIAKNILPVKLLYYFVTSCTIFKFLNGYSRHNFIFEFVSHNYATRLSTHKLILPIPRTDYGKDTFIYSAGSLFNSLPNELIFARSFFEFKRKAKIHFLDTIKLHFN
jgi:hypothetical protein